MRYDKHVHVRITSEEYEKLKTIADSENRTVSAFVRSVVINELKKTGEDRISVSSP